MLLAEKYKNVIFRAILWVWQMCYYIAANWENTEHEPLA
jgi:hypothetical protein